MSREAGTASPRRSLSGSEPQARASHWRALGSLAARPGAQVPLWAATVALALGLHGASRAAALAVCLGGVLLALSSLRAPLTSKAMTAVAMAPAAVGTTGSTWLWVGAAGLLAGAVALRQTSFAVGSHDLRRHIEWCRRRHEPAHVLVMRFDSVPAARVLEAFRLTDSVTIASRGSRAELHAVIDDQGFLRSGLERRLVEEAGLEADFGWSTFPEDGVTLDVLVEEASARLETAIRPGDRMDSYRAAEIPDSFVNAELQSEPV